MLLFKDQRRRQRMMMEARIIRIIGLLTMISVFIVVYLNIETVVENDRILPSMSGYANDHTSRAME